MQGNLIRAAYTANTVRVYQAYRPEIARPALDAQHFVPPFSMTRMTWIKPSFFWMMYRCGWGGKAGQDVVLGIDITRKGFDWALAHAALSSFHADCHRSEAEWRSQLAERPVRVQWDPDRDAALNPCERRAIQIGLKGEAVRAYVEDWIMRIEDVTPLARRIQALVADGRRAEAEALAPLERIYPMDPGQAPDIALAGATPEDV